MNNISIVGRVGRDPELKWTKDQKPVVTFSVATDHGKDDFKKTTWHNVVCFDSLAENVAQSIVKGSRVIVAGRLDISDYEDKEGTKKKKVELVASAIGLELRFEAIKSVLVPIEEPEEPF